MNPGEVVDDFTALNQEGEPVTLAELVVDGPIVLFFYPKANTGGCTAESCHFRDLKGEFAKHGARLVGISGDSPETQAGFDRSNHLGLALLSDKGGKVAKQLGANRMGLLWNKRKTYVIDQDRKILDVIASESNLEIHADQALEVLAGRGAPT